MVSFGHDLMEYCLVVSLISFFVNYIHPGVKKHEHIRMETIGTLGYGCLYVLCTAALFFRSFLERGPMNLEVSKSHSRCVATRQLISKHQLTFLSVHQHCMACTK